MRSILLALSLAVAPLTMAGACVAFEQVAPTSPRAALAQANVSFIGVVSVATTLRDAGLIPDDKARALGAVFVDLNAKLNTATELLKVGETVTAVSSLAEVIAALNALALELQVISENADAPVFSKSGA